MSDNRKSPLEYLKSTRGFTLIELLVVIGIIMILISILLPTVNQVRVAAQTANTRQMLTRIEAAAHQYFSDFQAYPGPFSNTEVGIAAPNGLKYFIDGVEDTSRTTLTSTENLFLGIVGGLARTPDFRSNITSTAFPNGPISLGSNLKRYQAYISIEPNETTAKITPRLFPGNAAGLGGSSDTNIPEFLDKYASPMPILYLRAQRGNAGGYANNNMQQYNFSHLAPYGFTAITGYGTNANDGGVPQSYEYFANTAASTTSFVPLKKDEFVLISAGADGKYGTTDDITSFR